MAARAPVFSPVHSAVRAPIVSAQVGGAPSAPFDPASLSGLLSRFLDTTPGYHGSTLGGLPILNAEESGTLARPRGQTCLQGDGVNDFAISASNVGVTGAANRTLCFRAKLSSTANQGIIGFGAASDFQLFQAYVLGGKWYFNGWGSGDYDTTINADTNWHNHAITYDGTSVRWYVDGVLIGTAARALNTANGVLNLLRRPNADSYSASQINNVRIYNVAKTAPQVLAIANQHLTPTTIDTAGLVALWWLNEESGSIAYDAWGNNDLTLTNGPTWTTDAGVNYNPANWLGHTQCKRLTGSSGAYIASSTWVSRSAKSGDCRFDFIAPTINANMVFGFQLESSAAATLNYEILDVGLQITSSTTLRVFTNNTITDHAIASVSGGEIFSIVRAGSTASIYVNGVLITTKTVSTADIYSAATFANIGVPLIVVNEVDNGTVGSTLAISDLVIPRNESNTSQDAAGNALGVTGPLKHPATTEVRCVTGDGSAVYVDLGSALIPATADFSLSLWYFHVTNNTTRRCILSQNGASAPETGRLMLWANASGGAGSSGAVEMQRDGSFVTITGALASNSWHHIAVSRVGNLYTLSCVSTASSLVNSNTISGDIYTGRNCHLLINNIPAPLYNDGRISDLRITTGGLTTFFPLQEGPGSSNTNRNRYWVRSDGTSGVVTNADVNGTVANINANYCPFVQDWCVNNGGGVAANGAFIPGRIGSNLDALGNAKTLAAGEQSPTSNICPNFWSTPELVNVGISASAKWARTTAVQATSPADTKFRNTTRGTKNLIYSSAKSGADKTNLETYVST